MKKKNSKKVLWAGILALAVGGIFAVDSLACGGKCPFPKKEKTSSLSSHDQVAKADNSSNKATKEKSDQTVVLPVSGMTCASCGFHVSRALKKLKGVKEAKADAESGDATVIYDPQKVTLEKMIEAVNKTGYKASLPRKEEPKDKVSESQNEKKG